MMGKHLSSMKLKLKYGIPSPTQKDLDQMPVGYEDQGWRLIWKIHEKPSTLSLPNGTTIAKFDSMCSKEHVGDLFT